MDILDKFFIPENHVTGITESDYERVAPLVAGYNSLARMTYQSCYIIDFYKRNLLYVSGNPLFLCGSSPQDVKDMGLVFHIRHVAQDEVDMLLEINRAGFDLINNTLPEDRLKLTFSCDFNLLDNRNEKILINHKLAPVMLSPGGEVWLAGCTVSLSSYKEAGHVKARMAGYLNGWNYSLESHQWRSTSIPVLQDREKKVLLLSVKGYTIEQIAEKMRLGTDSIKAYRQRIFEKMAVKNISEAIFFAINYQLI